MQKWSLHLLAAGLLCLAACKSDTSKEETSAPAAEAPRYEWIDKAAWMLGSWQNSSPEGSYSEHWTQLNDSTLSGHSYFVQGTDTLSSESITLEQRGGDLFYIPVVKEQNQGQPVSFKMTASEGQFVFENPEHDFPQRITYRQVSPDSLVAEISGMIEGKEQKQTFPLGKVKR